MLITRNPIPTMTTNSSDNAVTEAVSALTKVGRVVGGSDGVRVGEIELGITVTFTVLIESKFRSIDVLMLSPMFSTNVSLLSCVCKFNVAFIPATSILYRIFHPPSSKVKARLLRYETADLYEAMLTADLSKSKARATGGIVFTI
jgi:hypothetical protein